MYGAEIWGWNEQEEAEKVQEKYLRGIYRSGQRNARLHDERRGIG
jgi:hypothetical protein